MKIVIEIPEDVYTRLFDNGIQDNEIAVDDVCEMARAIRLGTPLEEVLWEIKAEIEAKAKERRFYMDSGHPYDGLYEALEIIDSYISGKEQG